MVTVSKIRSIYEEFNSTFFNDELPQSEHITFEVPNIKPIGQAQDKRWCGDGLKLRISSRYALTELQLRNTICHEMVHLWQYVTGHADHHGRYFKMKAYEIRQIDSNMVIERLFNPANEGKLVRSNQKEKSVIISWWKDNMWHVGRISANYTKAYGWLMEKYAENGIAMYSAEGGEFLMSLPKCYSSFRYWNITEESYMQKVFPYLTNEMV